MCKTNPISSGRRGMGAGGRETPPGSDGAKQSQFLREQQEEQVLCGKGVMVNRTCNRLRQNKANSWRARYPTLPVFHRSSIPVLSLLCETNPICHLAHAGGPEGSCETKPICCKRPRMGAGRQGRPWRHRGRICKTKPISATPRGTGRMPVVRNHGQDAHATGTPDGVAASMSKIWGQSSKTKPIPGRAGRVGTRGTRGDGPTSPVPGAPSLLRGTACARYCRGDAGRIGWLGEGGRWAHSMRGVVAAVIVLGAATGAAWPATHPLLGEANDVTLAPNTTPSPALDERAPRGDSAGDEGGSHPRGSCLFGHRVSSE